MDFIERWFHMFPDNGSGATEVLYFVATAALALFLRGYGITLSAKRCADPMRKSR